MSGGHDAYELQTLDREVEPPLAVAFAGGLFVGGRVGSGPGAPHPSSRLEVPDRESEGRQGADTDTTSLASPAGDLCRRGRPPDAVQRQRALGRAREDTHKQRKEEKRRLSTHTRTTWGK